MKFRKAFLAMVLLALCISAVSAADNMTDYSAGSDMQVTNTANLTEDSADNPANVTDDEGTASQINVTFDEKVYEKNLTNITVDFPENTSGNFRVCVNNYTIYDENITNASTVSIPIALPPVKFPVLIANVWPPMDCSQYTVTAAYNGIDVSVPHNLKVMLYPKDYAPKFMIGGEILQFSRQYSFMPAVMFPRSATGRVEIYLDGKLINLSDVKGPFVYLDASKLVSLELGCHSLLANYSGDDYFRPGVVNFTFNVTNAVISIPETVYLTHDDCISVQVLDTDKGSVSVYIDSKLVVKRSIDKYGEFLYSLFSDITCGSHEITVAVECGRFTRTRTVNVNATYSMEIYPQSVFRYGDENIVSVYMPEDLKLANFKVTINGKEYPARKRASDLEIDISKLEAGDYNITVTYLGDGKYYPYTTSHNFTVAYRIDYDDEVYFGFDSKVTLNLPTDAKGSLVVYLNGKLYKSQKLAGGKASIALSNLAPGEYVLNASYSGDDYNVSEVASTITAIPSITYECYVEVGDRNVLRFEVPKATKGSIIVYVASKSFTAEIKNGIATVDLSGLSIGDWDMNIDYYSERGYVDTYYGGVYVDYTSVKIKNAKSAKVLYSKGTYKVRVFGTDGKAAKNAKVIFKINGKKAGTVRTNSKGWATLKIPNRFKPGRYTISAECKSAKVSKKLTVSHILAVKKSKIKKSAKRLVLTAKLAKPLKGKKVTFRFKGKSYTAKTNKKGVAKITIKKSVLNSLEVGKKLTYKATYLKDTVKRTVRVQK